ncbi:collagenase [Kitasatospora sp. NPDC059327]|uniref:M9 family metallopeptidase n=1 Tax=Kitasatospora sp. NPDC059327 TaxID=3346803 RepID=UPI0036D061FA
MLTLALTLLLTVGLFAPRGQATPVPASSATGGATTAPTPTSTELAPPAADGSIGTKATHQEGEPTLTPSGLIPRQADDPSTDPGPAAKSLGRSAAAGEAAACDPADFGRTGAALVQLVKSVDLDCVNGLFQIPTAQAAAAFRESQMLTVADAVREAAAAYRGDNSGSIAQLMYYLQAGYFVQYGNQALVGPYDKIPDAVRSGVQAFFANPHALDATAENATPLAKATTLADVPRRSADYVPVVKQVLNAYNSGAWDRNDLLWSLNPVFNVLFRGNDSRDPAFLAAVRADPGVIDALYGFINRAGSQAGGPYGTVLTNAVNELGRFLAYPEFRPKVRSSLQALASTYSVTGPTRDQRAAVALAVGFNDKAACGSYGTCDDASRFKAVYLPLSYQCSPSIRILAQDMTGTQLADTCGSLKGQDAYFHAVARDNGPVADDNNSVIEVVVFDSRADYIGVAPIVFGANTNNGGIYLEGEPATPGNQPRFLAYEATWERPAFQIWNLNHEYTHYLDARYNLWGNFRQGEATPLVWWTEGLAEVVSDSYRKVVNTAAIDAAGRHTYRLSDLFDTAYGNEDRVYRWGYLAVRYMLEQHRADVDAVLAQYRKGDWAGARTLLKSTIGTRYDADFDSWLTRCAAGACRTTPTFPTFSECADGDLRKLDRNCVRGNVSATAGNYAHFYLLVPAGTRQLRITSEGGTGNGELYYNPYGWAYTNAYTTRSAGPGNSESLTVTNPPTGYVFFSLYAPEGFSGVSVTSEF